MQAYFPTFLHDPNPLQKFHWSCLIRFCKCMLSIQCTVSPAIPCTTNAITATLSTAVAAKVTPDVPLSAIFARLKKRSLFVDGAESKCPPASEIRCRPWVRSSKPSSTDCYNGSRFRIPRKSKQAQPVMRRVRRRLVQKKRSSFLGGCDQGWCWGTLTAQCCLHKRKP